jgi:endonuclease/exonuclease/phosphatase family metal-dependent hydrolase
MRATWSLVVLIPLSIGVVVPDASARSDDGKKVTFMTQNLYLGADLAPAVGAIVEGDFDAILTEVGGVWANVQATDFPTRAVAIADEVKAKKPDVLALQEAALWSVGAPLDPADADTVVYDFVEIMQDALAARGMRYDVVAVVDEFEAEAPGYVPDSLYGVLDIRLKLRDALLVRHGELKVSNASGHAFETNLVIPSPLGDIVSTYGWVQADVTIGRREFRVIGTHLDADVPPIREIQAGEVLAGPCDTELPVVVMGDFNSDGNGGATSAAYEEFRDAGFGDAWLDVHPDDLGLTYGQEPTLSDPTWPSTTTEPIERIDFVLYRGEFTSVDADRVGEETGDRIDGLWPSDHAGVEATLRVR